MTRAVRVVVQGRVQGVGYRAWTAETARALGLSGHVRNRRDGTVEALLDGEASAVDAMLTRMRRGPPAARIDRMDLAVGDGPSSGGFAVLSTE